MCRGVQNVDADWQVPDDAPPIKPRNPVKTASFHYLDASGGQVRDNRRMREDKFVGTNFDTAPAEDAACRKRFDGVRGGLSGLFTSFCTLTGVCLGGHFIIEGGEGRRDVFRAIFLHRRRPPTRIHYDFACFAEEFCLNRGYSYWADVQFYHDIFHGTITDARVSAPLRAACGRATCSMQSHTPFELCQ